MNKVILIGNLVRDVELKTTPTGAKVVSASIATNKSYIDKSGEKKKIVNYHNLVIWGKQAEVFSQYLSKGSKVAIVGELQTRDYVGKDNIKRYVTEVRVSEVEFLSPKPTNTATPVDPVENTVGEPISHTDDVRLEDIPF